MTDSLPLGAHQYLRNDLNISRLVDQLATEASMHMRVNEGNSNYDVVRALVDSTAVGALLRGLGYHLGGLKAIGEELDALDGQPWDYNDELLGVVEEAAVGQLLPLLASALGVAPSAISTELHSAGLDTWDAFDIFASKLGSGPDVYDFLEGVWNDAAQGNTKTIALHNAEIMQWWIYVQGQPAVSPSQNQGPPSLPSAFDESDPCGNALLAAGISGASVTSVSSRGNGNRLHLEMAYSSNGMSATVLEGALQGAVRCLTLHPAMNITSLVLAPLPLTQPKLSAPSLPPPPPPPPLSAMVRVADDQPPRLNATRLAVGGAQAVSVLFTVDFGTPCVLSNDSTTALSSLFRFNGNISAVADGAAVYRGGGVYDVRLDVLDTSALTSAATESNVVLGLGLRQGACVDNSGQASPASPDPFLTAAVLVDTSPPQLTLRFASIATYTTARTATLLAAASEPLDTAALGVALAAHLQHGNVTAIDEVAAAVDAGSYICYALLLFYLVLTALDLQRKQRAITDMLSSFTPHP